jgi:hypothetical protein
MWSRGRASSSSRAGGSSIPRTPSRPACRFSSTTERGRCAWSSPSAAPRHRARATSSRPPVPSASATPAGRARAAIGSW